jgi:glycosyltransferase involved in cell wall biosynthesis
MPPRLSVIIPTRDCLSYLPAAIASVRRQDLGPVEIIVVDDGSTDETPQWLAAEAARDPAIRPIYRPRLGLGPGAARNAALAVAQAPILACLDADDTWRPDAVLERLELHEARPQIVLSFADYDSVGADGARLGTAFAYWPRFRRWLDGRTGLLPLGEQALAMLYLENVVGTSTVLLARAALLAEGGFWTEHRVSSDWEMWLRLARRGEIWCSTRVAADYLVRENSVSRDLGAVLAAMRAIQAKYAAEAAVQNPAAPRIARAELAIVEATEARMKGETFQALRRHLAALLQDPSLRTARLAAYDAAHLAGLR